MFPAAPFLYPILDLDLLGTQPVARAAAALVDRGVRLLQVRGKTATDARLLEAVREVLAITRPRQALLVVNDRPDIALIAGADGVHVGQDDLRPSEVRRLVGPSLIVGLSTHDLVQVAAGDREPVDYVAFGPVFATRTKAQADPVVGTTLLAEARRTTTHPLVAIGGITPERAAGVLQAGADGLAVAGPLCGPDAPRALDAFLSVLTSRV
jgi:thiamine-phosphate pyrophosphorylase